MGRVGRTSFTPCGVGEVERAYHGPGPSYQAVRARDALLYFAPRAQLQQQLSGKNPILKTGEGETQTALNAQARRYGLFVAHDDQCSEPSLSALVSISQPPEALTRMTPDLVALAHLHTVAHNSLEFAEAGPFTRAARHTPRAPSHSPPTSALRTPFQASQRPMALGTKTAAAPRSQVSFANIINAVSA